MSLLSGTQVCSTGPSMTCGWLMRESHRLCKHYHNIAAAPDHTPHFATCVVEIAPSNSARVADKAEQLVDVNKQNRSTKSLSPLAATTWQLNQIGQNK